MALITLHEFMHDVGKGGKDYTKPPYRLPCDKLDENFKKVQPAEQQGDEPPYLINSGDEGWTIEPQIVFDVCENGQPVQYRILAKRFGGAQQ